MGARGKKRVRANGQVATGKLAPRPQLHFVPPIDPELIRSGLEVFRRVFREAGNPDPDGDAWDATYRSAQARFHEEFGHEIGDAILWRVTFLAAFLNWDEFQRRHELRDDLPTAQMLQVAGTIATHGAELSFDLALFENMLADLKR